LSLIDAKVKLIEKKIFHRFWIMANKVQTPVQNYFEKVLYENLTF
jgi:hypothetical protein